MMGADQMSLLHFNCGWTLTPSRNTLTLGDRTALVDVGMIQGGKWVSYTCLLQGI